MLTFWFTREKQMWEANSRISAVESRGANAILSVDARLQRIETLLSEERDRANFLERKNDRIEILLKELQESRGKYYDPTGGQR